MLPCRVVVLTEVVAALAFVGPCAAEPLPANGTQTAINLVRYHYGDDPRWADPAFDDMGWSVARDGQVPQGPLESGGFFWVRVHVPTPSGLPGSIGVQSVDAFHGPEVQQIFVNGHACGQHGAFPPRVEAKQPPRTLTYAIPDGVLAPGTAALVSLRGWSLPISRIVDGPRHFAFVIDRLTVLETAAQADFAVAFLATLPPIIPNLLMFLVGILLLVVFHRVATRELIFNALTLITIPLYIVPDTLLNAGIAPANMTIRTTVALFGITEAPCLWAAIEFLWALFPLRSRALRILGHACWIVYLIADQLAWQAPLPDLWLRPLESLRFAAIVSFCAFNLVIQLWALFIVHKNRIIAAALTLVYIPPLLAYAGFPWIFHIGPVEFDGQVIGSVIAIITITAMLVYRAIAGWRTSQLMEAEFEAAREVQQRLVPSSLPSIAGLSIQVEYRPAARVSGDFYQILPLASGATFIVVGDVSGKGLPAAMKSALAIGSLRSVAREQASPAQVLHQLNEILVDSQDGGFITCLGIRVTPNGFLTLSNAGHLAPYCNGKEIALPPGFPLGLVHGVDYSETTCELAPGDILTLLSDGVVEARNSQGELFGFERTAAISVQPAESIAQAAQSFGQEDDITVLSLTFTRTRMAQTGCSEDLNRSCEKRVPST